MYPGVKEEIGVHVLRSSSKNLGIVPASWTLIQNVTSSFCSKGTNYFRTLIIIRGLITKVVFYLAYKAFFVKSLYLLSTWPPAISKVWKSNKNVIHFFKALGLHGKNLQHKICTFAKTAKFLQESLNSKKSENFVSQNMTWYTFSESSWHCQLEYAKKFAKYLITLDIIKKNKKKISAS